MEGDVDDFLALAALAALPAPAGALCGEELAAVVAADEAADAIGDEELAALVAVRPQRRRLEQRSREHAANARAGKAAKRARHQQLHVQSQLDDAKAQLSLLAVEVPSAFIRHSALAPRELALAKLQVAASTTRRGGDRRQAQARYACEVTC